MDRLPELLSTAVECVISGVTYKLMPLRLVDWAEAGRYLQSKRKPPLEVIKPYLADLSPDNQRHLLLAAYDDERMGEFIPAHTLERWFQTEEGRIYKLWLQLRQCHPELNIDAVERLMFASAAEAVALEKAAKENEGAPLGNSSGPAGNRAETTPPQTPTDAITVGA